jgi:hypothetical protein
MTTGILPVRFHEGITHRLSVIGVPTHVIKGFTNDIVRWATCSGIEWTISRLKALKVDLIHAKDGQKPLTPVRKNRKGEIAGHLGSLFRWAMKSEDNFGKAIQALMAYSQFVFGSHTPKQAEKFVKAVSAEPPMIPRKFLRDLGRSVEQNFRRVQIDRDQELSLLVYRGSSSKFKPSQTHAFKVGSGYRFASRVQNQDVLSNAQYFLTPAHVPLYFEYESLFAPILKGLTGVIDSINHLGTWYKRETRDLVEGGEVHFIQEAGGKLRSVASPHLVHQLALKPFGDSIYKLVRSLPWDCTFDQSKPLVRLQTHLSEGHTVFSVDLSSATDYFPLEIQVTVLRALFGSCPDLRLFEDISKSYWRCPIGVTPNGLIRWKRGQPLGLYPSFASFTLSHGILLWFLNGSKHEDKFFVLGDDVVILDKDLYDRYIQFLKQMDCPYSREKSISSANICEFAGKIVTSSRIISQYKWREISNDNFLDICRQLGCRSRSLLSKRQKRIFDKVKHCTLPYGLNFSYPGSNLIKMQEETEKLFRPNDTVVGSLMGLSSTIHQNVYGEQNFDEPWKQVSMDHVLKIIETFDVKVRSVLLKLLPKEFVATFLVHLKDLGGLSGVPEAVSENRDLPSLRLLPSRVTTLERYERLLSH